MAVLRGRDHVRTSKPRPGQDAAARRRPCPATTRGARRATRNALPADPPRVEEIVAVMRLAGESVYGDRLHGIIVVLCREATCDSSSRKAGANARWGAAASFAPKCHRRISAGRRASDGAHRLQRPNRGGGASPSGRLASRPAYGRAAIDPRSGRAPAWRRSAGRTLGRRARCAARRR